MQEASDPLINSALAMFVSHNKPSNNYNGNQGYTRGGRGRNSFLRGRGGGGRSSSNYTSNFNSPLPHSQQQSSFAPSIKSNKPTCQIYWKQSHYAIDCYHRMDFAYQGKNPTTKLAAMASASNIHHTQTAKTWLIDSGASDHITASSNNLNSQVPYQGQDQVSIGPIQNIGLKHTNDTSISPALSQMTPDTWINNLISLHTCSHNPQVHPNSSVEPSQRSTGPSPASSTLTPSSTLAYSTLPPIYTPADTILLPNSPHTLLPNSPNTSPIPLPITDTLPSPLPITSPPIDPISAPSPSPLLNPTHTAIHNITASPLPPGLTPHLLSPHLTASWPHAFNLTPSTSRPSPHFSASPPSLSLLNPFRCCPSLPRSHHRLKARTHTVGAPKLSISPSTSLRLSDLSTPPIQKLLYLCKSHVVDVDAGATLVEVGATLVEAVVSQPESACTQQAGSTLVKPSLTPTGEGLKERDNSISKVRDAVRKKLTFLKFCFSKLYGEQKASGKIANVRDVLTKLFDYYASVHSPNVEVESVSEKSTITTDVDMSETNPYAFMDSQYDLYLEAEQSMGCNNELDKYLAENCEGRKDMNFDVLLW
uniref:Uncharacterized protein n=1 Tax=Fagus sylvatica TaxID=28930 RepID=A0A2N9I1N5_FAGSY